MKIFQVEAVLVGEAALDPNKISLAQAIEAVRYRARRVEDDGDDDQPAPVADFERAAARVNTLHCPFESI